MSIMALPTPAQLRAAPQLGALAILDAALVTAEEVLLAHYPNLGDLDGTLAGERPPLDGDLVPILIAHFDELRHLLGRYRVTVWMACLTQNDDFPF